MEESLQVEVWLVRHGETEWNQLGKMQGWSDVPLNEKGRRQAQALRAWLVQHRFDGVYSSDLSRAAQTAWLAYGEARLTPALREAHFGHWEGGSWLEREDIRSALINFDSFAAPGGENATQVKQRLGDFLGALPRGRHLCFSHGGAIRAIMRQVGADQRIHNCSVTAINWSQQRLLFVRNLDEHDPFEG